MVLYGLWINEVRQQEVKLKVGFFTIGYDAKDEFAPKLGVNVIEFVC
jgi:hypothetical protein